MSGLAWSVRVPSAMVWTDSSWTGRACRLHSHSAYLGRGPLDGGGDAGDQPAASDGSCDQAGVRKILQDLQGEGALSGGNEWIGVGVDLHHALLPHQLGGPFLPLGGERTHQLHLSAPALDPSQLHRVGVGGHDDDRLCPQLVGGVGHPLGVVARGGAHQAAAQLLLRQGEGLVEGTADLEGADGLEALVLEIDLTAQGLIQGGDTEQGRADDVGGDPGPGGLDITVFDHKRDLPSDFRIPQLKHSLPPLTRRRGPLFRKKPPQKIKSKKLKKRLAFFGKLWYSI